MLLLWDNAELMARRTLLVAGLLLFALGAPAAVTRSRVPLSIPILGLPLEDAARNPRLEGSGEGLSERAFAGDQRQSSRALGKYRGLADIHARTEKTDAAMRELRSVLCAGEDAEARSATGDRQ